MSEIERLVVTFVGDDRNLNRAYSSAETGARRTARNISSTLGDKNIFGGFASNFQSQLRDAQGRFVSSGASFLRDSLTVTAGDILTGGISKVSGLTKDLVIRGVEYNNLLERSNISFEVLLGSQEKAKQHMKDLAAFAEKAGSFQLTDVIRGSQRLQAMGFDARNVVSVLTDVSDAASAMGGGQEILDGIVTALGQMKGNGRLAAEEMNQLTERGIPAWRMLSELTGKTQSELRKLSEQGKLNGGVAVEGFLRKFREYYGGLGDKLSDTFDGRMSNFNDRLDRRLAEGTLSVQQRTGELVQAASDVLNSPQGEAVAKGFDSIANLAMKPVELLIKGATTGFDLKALMSQLAWDMVGGIKEGLENKAGELKDEGKKVVTNIYGAIKQEAGINSPAKKFIPLGEGIAEGLQVGFTSYMLSHAGSFVQEGLATIRVRTEKTLRELAEKFNLDLDRLAATNGIGKDTPLQIGQEIIVPATTAVPRNKQSRRSTNPSLADKARGNYADLLKREPGFERRLNQVASYLGIEPEWLLNTMAVETIGTFSPKIENGKGYTGLIQFGPDARKSLGVSNDQLKKMTATEQLDYVQQYYEMFKAVGQMKSQADVYNVVTGGQNLLSGFPLDPNSIVYGRGSKAMKVKSNRDLWDVNGDGQVQNFELGTAAAKGGFTSTNPMPVRIVSAGSDDTAERITSAQREIDALREQRAAIARRAETLLEMPLNDEPQSAVVAEVGVDPEVAARRAQSMLQMRARLAELDTLIEQKQQEIERLVTALPDAVDRTNELADAARRSADAAREQAEAQKEQRVELTKAEQAALDARKDTDDLNTSYDRTAVAARQAAREIRELDLTIAKKPSFTITGSYTSSTTPALSTGPAESQEDYFKRLTDMGGDKDKYRGVRDAFVNSMKEGFTDVEHLFDGTLSRMAISFTQAIEDMAINRLANIAGALIFGDGKSGGLFGKLEGWLTNAIYGQSAASQLHPSAGSGGFGSPGGGTPGALPWLGQRWDTPPTSPFSDSNQINQTITSTSQASTRSITTKIETSSDKITASVTAAERDITASVDSVGQTVQQLVPVQDGFWSGLGKALLGSTISTLVGGFVGDIFTPTEDSGETGPQPTHAPTLKSAQKKARGGPIFGAGTGTSDDIPIWASNGEHMITARAADYYGHDFFDRANRLELPRQAYAEGGAIYDDVLYRPQSIGSLSLEHARAGAAEGGSKIVNFHYAPQLPTPTGSVPVESSAQAATRGAQELQHLLARNS
jgi:tape measure domain-containing protein